MASSYQDILTPSVVTGLVSRLSTPGTNGLTKFFGMQPGGPNTEQISGRTYNVDIFDSSRAVATGKMPGAPANAIAWNPVGSQPFQCLRFNEKIIMDYDAITNIRSIGENAGVKDRMGMNMVKAQARYLSERQNNIREFILGSLSRGGKMYFYLNSTDFVPTYVSSSTFLVDMAIGSENININDTFQAGLQMDTGGNLITATWATATNNIPVMLQNISDAFVAQTGLPLQDVIIDGITWQYILQNDYVRNIAGSANKVWSEYAMTADKNSDGTPQGVFVGVLAGLPQYRFLVYSGQIKVNTSATAAGNVPVIKSGHAIFRTWQDSSMFCMVEGSEPVKDNDLAPAVERFGSYSWLMERADPARVEMHSLCNIGPKLTRPKSFAVSVVR